MEVDESVRYTFQFQTGAIKSRYAHMCSSGTCARFNSKLVRLEVKKIAAIAEVLKSFNSKLVRLEDRLLCRAAHHAFCGFNSKLVRLEVIRDTLVWMPESVFQFQTGAIRSSKPEPMEVSEESFNSKLVRLEVRRRKSEVLSKYLFQFQTGSIRRFN